MSWSFFSNFFSLFDTNWFNDNKTICFIDSESGAQHCLTTISEKYPVIVAQKFGTTPSTAQSSQINVNDSFPNQIHAGAILDKTGTNIIGTVGTNASIQQVTTPIPVPIVKLTPPPLPSRPPPPLTIKTHVGNIPIVIPTDDTSHNNLIQQTMTAPFMNNDAMNHVRTEVNAIPMAPPLNTRSSPPPLVSQFRKLPPPIPTNNTGSHPIALSYQTKQGITPLILIPPAPPLSAPPTAPKLLPPPIPTAFIKATPTTSPIPSTPPSVKDHLDAIRSGMKLRGLNAPQIKQSDLVKKVQQAANQSNNIHKNILEALQPRRAVVADDDDDDDDDDY